MMKGMMEMSGLQAQERPTSHFRRLDAGKVAETVSALSRRIERDFPDADLNQLGKELVIMAAETGRRIEELQRPSRRIRLAVWSLIVLVLMLALGLPVVLNVRNDVSGILGLMQGIESAVNNLIFVAVAIYFLLTFEMRPKRNAALKALHELRSVAHIVDMHQLSKDPSHAVSGTRRTADEGGQRLLTRKQLATYLDLCSELLSMISKLAALYAYHLNDATVLGAVSEVEQVCDGLQNRCWTKIEILDLVEYSETGAHIAGSENLEQSAVEHD